MDCKLLKRTSAVERKPASKLNPRGSGESERRIDMEDLRFPIGKFDWSQRTNTPEERKKLIDSIAEVRSA